MQSKELSENAKGFIQSVIESGEHWLGEAVKKMMDEANNEAEFLEDLMLYLTRMEIKIRDLKEKCEKLSGLV